MKMAKRTYQNLPSKIKAIEAWAKTLDLSDTEYREKIASLYDTLQVTWVYCDSCEQPTPSLISHFTKPNSYRCSECWNERSK